MSEVFTNNVSTTLNGAIDNSTTSVVVTSATGFPSTGEFRILVVAEGANTDEIMTVTGRSGTTLTVVRASEPTGGTQAASAHASGATVVLVLTAGALHNAGLASGTIGCSVSGNSTSVGAAYTALAFNSTDTFDTDGFHDPSSNNTRVTIPAGLGGKYLLSAFVSFYETLTDRRLGYRINGGSDALVLRQYYGTTGTTITDSISEILELSGGDYVEVIAYQGSTQTITNYRAQLIKLDSGKVGSGVGAAAYWTSGTLGGTGSYYSVPLGGEYFDTDGFHDNSTNNSRFTVPPGLSGKYLFNGEFYGNSSNGYATIKKNGADAEYYSHSGTSGVVQVSGIFALESGDYLELGVNWGNTNITSSKVSIMRLDSNPIGLLASSALKRDNTSAYTTSSTSWGAIDSTNLSITLTTGARRCLVTFTGIATGASADGPAFDFNIDGTRFNSSSTFGITYLYNNSNGDHVDYTVITDVLSAGSHTFVPVWRSINGASVGLNSYASQVLTTFAVQELPDSGALASDSSITTPIGRTLQKIIRTAGNITLTGSVTSMTEVSSALRLTIPAVTGDVLQIQLSGMFNAGATGEAAIDAATIISGSIVNTCTTGSRGSGFGYTSGTVATTMAGVQNYAVVSGDISAGNVTVSPCYINSSTNTGLFYGTSTYPCVFSVINLGH